MNSRLLTYATVAIIPVVYLAGAWHAPYITDPTLIKSATAEVFASALLLLWLSVSRFPEALKLTQWSTVAGVVFFGYATLSILWASNQDFFLDAWLKWFSAAVVFGLAALISRDQSRIPVVLHVFVASAFLVALIGLVQHYMSWEYLVQSAKPGSTFSNRNMAGHVMVICFPLAFFQLFHSQATMIARVVSGLALAILALYAYHIKASGTWIAISVEMIAVAVFLAWRLSRVNLWSRNKLIGVGVASSLIVAMFLFLPIFQLASIWNLFTQEVVTNVRAMLDPEYQLGTRLDIWAGALAIISDTPVLGVGLGNFYEVWSNGSYIQHSNLLSSQRVHNDLLELTVDLGLVGIGLIALLVILLLKSGISLLFHQNETIRLASVLIMISLLGFTVIGLVSFPLQVIAPLVSVAMLGGLLAGLSKPSIGSVAVPLTHVKPIAVFLALSLFVSTVYVNRQWLSDMKTLSERYNDGTQLTPWQQESVATNPNMINLTRMIVIGNLRYGGIQQANSFVVPLTTYWEGEPLNLALATEVNLNLGNLQQAETYASKLRLTQPVDSLAAEHYLLTIYSARGQGDKLRELYLEMRQLDAGLVQREVRHMAALHCLSILFGDGQLTEKLYSEYGNYHGPDLMIEANMAVYFANAGRIFEAKQREEWVSARDPGLRNSWQLDRIRKAEGEMQTQLRPFYKITLEKLKVEPLLNIFASFY